MDAQPDSVDADFAASLKSASQGAAPSTSADALDPEFANSLAGAGGQPSGSGVGANLGAGIWGSIADLAGLPGDIAGAPMIGSESIKRGMGAIGLGPKAVTAATPAELAAQDIGNAIGSMVLPGLGAEATLGSKAAEVMGPVAKSVLQAVRGGDGSLGAATAKNAVIGAGAGVGSTAAQAVVPDQYKPLAGAAGSIIGGGIGAAGAEGFRAALHRQSEFEANGVTYNAKTADEAGRFLTNSATDPTAAKEALANYEPRPDIDKDTPGFRPNTGPVSNDPGLLQVENWARNQNPAAFTAKAQQNNAALVKTTQGIQPTGDTAAVAQTFRGQLAAIDRAGQDVIQGAQQHLSDTLGRMGGLQYADTAGASAAEQYGAAVRSYVQEGLAEQKRAENALWQTLREAAPDMRFSPVSVSEAVSAVTRPGSSYFNPEAGSQLTPEETRLYGLINEWGNKPQPQQNIATMRSNIGDEIARVSMPGPSSNGQAARRLIEVRNALDDALGQAVTDRVTADDAAVAAGQLDPDRTLKANLERAQAEFYARKSGQQQQASVLDGGGQNPDGNGGMGSASVPSNRGSPSQAGQGPTRNAGDQGVAPPDRPLNPETGEPYTPEELQQLYGAARQATRERHAIFEASGAAKTPAGEITARGPYGGPNPVPDAAVAAKFWKGGDKGPQAWDNYVAATGGRRQALDTLTDYAAHDLRRSATNPDGSINERQWRSWLTRHQDTLGRDPQLMERFSAPARAQQQITEATRTHAEALEQYERSAARHFLNKEDPTDAVQAALKAGPADARQLVRLAQQDRTGAALQGLRRSVVDWLMDRAAPQDARGVEAGNTGTNWIKSATFRKLVEDHNAALRQLLTPEQMTSLHRVADDLQVADRSISGSKAPIGPGTARDVAATERHGTAKPSLLQMALHSGSEVSGLLLGEHVGGIMGAVVGKVGVEAITKFRAALAAAHLESRNRLIGEAVLHPEVAHALMLRVTPTNLPSLTETLMRSAARAGLFGLPRTQNKP